MKKYIYILLVPFLLLNCDYKPIYSKKNNTNFSIEKIGFKGDKEINNLVNKKLKKYQNNNNENKFFIEITSSYTKNIFTSMSFYQKHLFLLVFLIFTRWSI